ncbi:MAG: hypothetical protein AAF570_21645, partial [Bacteroidota bacterium]
MKSLLLFLITLVTTSLSAQSFGWVETGVGGSDIVGTRVETASNEDYVVGGEFSGAATFGSVNLTGSADGSIFVCRYDSSGSIQWGKSFSSTDEVEFGGLATGPSGETYLCGTFEGTLTMGTITVSNIEDENGFLAKLDASGNVSWVVDIESGEEAKAGDVAVDGIGRVIVIGSFEEDVVLDSITLTDFGEEAMFVAAFNGSGDVLWAAKASSGDGIEGKSVRADAVGNVYVTGEFEGATQFGTTTLPNADDNDLFVTKLDNSGNFLWANGVGGSDDVGGNSLALSSGTDVFVVGEFEGSAIFSLATLSSTGSTNGFLAKYNTSGA